MMDNAPDGLPAAPQKAPQTAPPARGAVVIVTHNSAADIDRCLASLLCHVPGLGLGPDAIAVHVVDNGSSDGTVARLRAWAADHPWLVVHLSDCNLGFGAANNLVLRAGAARHYLLLNADAWLVADSITPALAALQRDPGLGVIGLPLVYPDGRAQSYRFLPSAAHRWALLLLGLRPLALAALRWRPAQAVLRQTAMGRNFTATHAAPPLDLNDPAALARTATGVLTPAHWVAGAAMALAGPFVAQSQGFDPQFFLYGEDEDLCLTAHRLGYGVATLATVPVVHKLGWGGAPGFRAGVARHKYRSLQRFIAKNIRSRLERQVMLILLPFYVYGHRIGHVLRTDPDRIDRLRTEHHV